MIDAHHHIWRQADLPWLQGPERPRIFGPYAGIKRDYLIGEYLGDIRTSGIEKSVYVQANWAPDRFEDEIAWVQSVADSTGWPHGIVGYMDVTQDNIGPALSRLRGYPLLRGFRQQFHWHDNPLYRFAPDARQLAEPRVAANIARLAEYDLSFDLQVFSGQMEDAAALAGRMPGRDVHPAACRHAKMTHQIPVGPLGARAMTDLAGCRNVVVNQVRLWHLYPPQRPRFHQPDGRRDRRPLWLGSLHFRLELSDRKTLDAATADLVSAFRAATASNR